MIDHSLLVRAFGLYAPFLLAVAIARARRRTRAHAVAVLAGSSWSLPSLLLVQLLNLRLHWWTFHAQGGLIRGMPADLYLGWTVLWGALPALILPRARLLPAAAAFIGLDLILMPACSPVVTLSRGWLAGELAAVVIVFVPARLFARWTLDRSHTSGRATFWVISFSALTFFLVPETIFVATGHGSWLPLRSSSWVRSAMLQGLILLGVAGISAAQEFARRGLGTPIPFDPPVRLVTSGLYRYLSSPMQISAALAALIWGLLLRDLWVVAIGPTAVVYSAGLARWHEDQEMQGRFGDAWVQYRSKVPPWRPRWIPWYDPSAPRPRLYVAAGCGPCSQVRRWFERHAPAGLEIAAAEDHPFADLTRITYDPMDGTPAESGVAAIARGLEHINFAWAFAGAFLRLPGVRWVSQVLVDAAGFGPRVVKRETLSCRL